ncbi:MAG: hypothetical protein ACHBN1_13915 [Heteroscytonema crispum UTEX LB 1556]
MLDLNPTLLARITSTFIQQKSLNFPAKNGEKSSDISLNTAIAQLQREVEELEAYENKLAKQKQRQERDILQIQVEQGVQELEAVSHRINTLATQLEAEMLKFKEIAVEVNRGYHLIQLHSESEEIESNESKVDSYFPINIWQVHYSEIPTVIKRGFQFILTAKKVDMFKAEREIDVQKRAEAAQKRRKALERWLTEKHKPAV